MAHTGTTQYQYLESLDSTRILRPRPGEPDGEYAEEAHLQVFTEVLMTLALGRTVVVPQSYAFDSYAFLRVATDVLRARTGAAADHHPFRVHLHGARSYREAVDQMLARARTADPAQPFLSRLLPELNDPAAHDLDPGELHEHAADFERLRRAPWLDDERAAGLRLIADEFDWPPVDARPPARTYRLGELVVGAADPSSPMGRSAANLPEQQRDVHAALAAAIRLLGTDRPESFDNRSRLRLPLPWPGDPDGRSPAQIIGDPETLALLVEFVDTLYNVIVVDSIGVADATLSTDLALDEHRLTGRAVAQELALAQYRSRTHPTAWLPPAPAAEGTPPLFRIELDAAAALTDDQARARLAALRANATDAVAALLRARAEPRARSPFWRGVDALRAAEDQRAARAALDAHLAHVATLVGSGVAVSTRGGSLVEMALTAAGAVGPALATEAWHLPGLLSYSATAVGAVGSLVYGKTKQAAAGRRRTRGTACALGRVVDVRG
ncbi:hypothetical protein [Kitasatospora phosalacinea]|uniref:Uncharacterized protein n=1 Tax=Kitasatospora phosalacinea TaxID=2065 RepID=A0A9W6PCJ5_9ACTN|nr:hypothetical protein [Kitasatospora phosalacinea]GLW53330.1 hypothetical protein Kpho01_13410 [Kitasatospora phosalacinea]